MNSGEGMRFFASRPVSARGITLPKSWNHINFLIPMPDRAGTGQVKGSKMKLKFYLQFWLGLYSPGSSAQYSRVSCKVYPLEKG